MAKTPENKPVDVKIVETLNYVDLAGAGVGLAMIALGLAGGWAVFGLSAAGYGAGVIYSRYRTGKSREQYSAQKHEMKASFAFG